MILELPRNFETPYRADLEAGDFLDLAAQLGC